MKALDQKELKKEPAQENPTELKHEQAALWYLLSPACTGVFDELLALLRLGIVSIKGSIPRLTKDWYERVNLHFLSEMHECWSPHVDKSGKYLVNQKIRRKLSKEWVIVEDGWASRDDPDDVIFDFDSWDEWRESFFQKQEDQSNKKHGIHRFGLEDFGV